jgi:hypothetical protein
VFEDVPGEGYVECISSAKAEVEPREIMLPIPNPMAQEKSEHDEDGVEREEIGRESDDKVITSDDDVAAFGGSFEFLYFAAKEPGPESVCEFVAEDVQEHGLGKEKVNDQPTGRAGQEWDPDKFGAAASA